jgi:hypothetical protein
MRTAQRRYNAEKDSHNDTNSRGEKQHVPAQCGVSQTRDSERASPHGQSDTPRCHQQSRYSACNCEDETFSKELANEPNASRAQCDANGGFPCSGR